MAYQQHEHPRDEARDADDLEPSDSWVTVRQAAGQVGRSVNWVRRQYRSGSVESRTQAGPHGPERLVDVDALRAIAEARGTSPLPAQPQSPPLPVLAETIHELARQLGEVQERAARAEADAEELRQRLADAEQAVADPGPPSADPEQAVADPAADAPERHALLWLAANRQFLRTLPGAAAREAAGARLAGGRRVDLGRGTRPWRRWR